MNIRHEMQFDGNVFCGDAKIIFERDFHWHEHYEIVAVESGEIGYYIDGCINHLSVGDMIVVDPYVIHCAIPVERIGGTVLVFSFTETYLTNLLPNYVHFKMKIASKQNMRKNDFEIQSSILSSARQILNFYRNVKNDADLLVVKGYINILIGLFITQANTEIALEISSVDQQKNEKIKNVCKYIENHTQDNISLEELAELTHYSPSHFMRVFKKSIGCTLKEYVDFVKIKEAQRLLRNGKMNITDVSYHLGFSHPNNFSRTYKRITGNLPHIDTRR